LRIGRITAWHSSSGRQPNFAALNRGRHLYSAGWPSRWALAHIASFVSFLSVTVTLLNSKVRERSIAVKLLERRNGFDIVDL